MVHAKRSAHFNAVFMHDGARPPLAPVAAGANNMVYLTPRYDSSLVLASVLIASLASYVALDLAKRIREADRSVALVWWGGGSIAMGTGIWSMHFVGMLAFSLPIALGYTHLLTFISWAAAVAVSVVALGLASRGSLTAARLAGGSLAMGVGICAMHYLGMAALDMSPPIAWDGVLVAASAAIAVIASAAALIIFFGLRRVSQRHELAYQVAAAAVMGLAISGMHYTGMAAAGFPEGSVCLSASVLSGGNLSLLVGAAAVTVLGLTLFTSIINGRMQEARLAGSLRIANADLQRTTENLKSQIVERERIETRLQAQLERLTLLDQISRAIGERQDLQSIYQVAIRSLEERLPVDFACVCRYDAKGNALTVIRVGAHSQALAMGLAMDEQSHIEIDQNGLSRAVRGELVYEADIREIAFPFPQRLARGGLRSLVVAPLQSESRVFGILVVARRQAESFSSSDCEFLRQLSTHVALAARQAELHGALQQAYDDLRETQQTAMQQERLRALGQMASGIAHDINNALSPVALYTESLLEREPTLSERGRGYLVTIARAIDDVAATVARMREFYRQREPQLVPTPVHLNLLVQQVVDLTRARWSDMPQSRGIVIDLAIDLAPDLPVILGVESEVRESLTNLVFNAVDAMFDGGVLTLCTRCTGAPERRAVVEVTDTGVGMSEDTRRRCLEPFFTTKGERGTGLGLAMVYGVAQRHDAEIDVESVVGSGTTVRLSFPVPATLLPASAVPALAEAPNRRLRVLIVDDDPVMLKSLCDTLELDGHVVVVANGGQVGIDAFHAAGPDEAFDVVITDLGMPYIDGRAVAGAVKTSAKATPVILLTGWGQRLIADDDVPAHVDLELREVRAALAQLTLRSSHVGNGGEIVTGLAATADHSDVGVVGNNGSAILGSAKEKVAPWPSEASAQMRPP
jgi:NO-binding membrane sensor protein with MHYT domain/signal transduction histidine kinase